MRLNTRRWGPAGGDQVICVHGITQHGGVFEDLGRQLATDGLNVLSVDLRGHGDSGREPPWDVGTHVDDLIETIDGLGIERAAWIGHSFGGRLAAAVAAATPARVTRLALLEPGIDVSPEKAFRYAEIDRLDWSFATVEGAVNALMTSDAIVATPVETLAEYVRGDVRQGADGRFRFRFCPSAVVVAWSEMTLPPPPIARVPTLLAIAIAPLFDARPGIGRYRGALGPALTVASLPNGHNVLWESPAETAAAVRGFLAAA